MCAKSGPDREEPAEQRLWDPFIPIQGTQDDPETTSESNEARSKPAPFLVTTVNTGSTQLQFGPSHDKRNLELSWSDKSGTWRTYLILDSYEISVDEKVENTLLIVDNLIHSLKLVREGLRSIASLPVPPGHQEGS